MEPGAGSMTEDTKLQRSYNALIEQTAHRWSNGQCDRLILLRSRNPGNETRVSLKRHQAGCWSDQQCQRCVYERSAAGLVQRLLYMLVVITICRSKG